MKRFKNIIDTLASTSNYAMNRHIKGSLNHIDHEYKALKYNQKYNLFTYGV